MAVDDSYTVSLLHMDGSDASTTFTDESGKTWTANGNAQIDTAQSVFGGASGLFDGTGDYVSTPYVSDFQLGTGDFSIDFRVRPNSLSGTPFVLWIGNDGNYNGSNYAFFNASKLQWGMANAAYSASISLTSTTTFSTGTWYHVAVTRNGSDLRLFINGTIEATASSSLDNSGCVDSPIVELASQYHTTYRSNYFNGWIDEFRFSKGIARWTSNFTPPTSAYAQLNQVIWFS